jgi:hypothetical protein
MDLGDWLGAVDCGEAWQICHAGFRRAPECDGRTPEKKKPGAFAPGEEIQTLARSCSERFYFA